MVTLLTEIAQLDAAIDVAFLSKHGRKLYGQSVSSILHSQHQADVWLSLLNHLNKPQTAQFIFSTGIYYVCSTQIGYLIVAVKEENELDDVKRKCIAIQAKLSDSSQRKEALLQMLGMVEDELKPVVLEELVPLADKEVARSVLPMLAEYAKFPENIRNELIFAIIQILGECTIFEAIKPLRRFLKRYEADSTGGDPQIINATKVSIMQLELSSLDENAQRPAQEFEGSALVESPSDQGISSDSIDTYEAEEVVVSESPSQSEKSNSHPNQPRQKDEKKNENGSEETRVRQLLKSGRKPEAVAIIMKYIEAAAKQRLFDKAEKLREKLIEIDSMMLTEIIRAAEIIEEEKIASILPEHLEIFEPLAKVLSEEEFSALYHAMSLEQYKNGEIVVQQGAFLSKLFFVTNGELQTTALVNDQHIPLNKIEAGQVLEGGSFFEASVWTINVNSLGTELLVLPRKQLEKLSENYPAIETKLIDFCAQFPSPSKILGRHKKNRRKFQRIPYSGRVSVTLLDKNHKAKAASFKGDLFDISRGGLAFSIRSSKKKNANLLLGNSVNLTLQSGSGIKSLTKEFTGVIVAVRGHHVVSNEYSVHVDFDRVLALNEIQELAGTEKK